MCQCFVFLCFFCVDAFDVVLGGVDRFVAGGVDVVDVGAGVNEILVYYFLYGDAAGRGLEVVAGVDVLRVLDFLYESSGVEKFC